MNPFKLFALSLVLLFTASSQASNLKYSDLSNDQREAINAHLVHFLSMYANAVDIALYNIDKQHVGTMDTSAPMGELSIGQATADKMFVRVEKLYASTASMKGFAKARAFESVSQAAKEIEQAKVLAFHISHRPWKSAVWTQYLDSQLEVISDSADTATIRVKSINRPDCQFTVTSNSSVHQSCN